MIRAVALDDPAAMGDLVALRRAWVEERDGGPIDDPAFEARLRAWLVAEARARGFDRVVLNPSARSVPFYRRAGFVPADGLLLHPLR